MKSLILFLYVLCLVPTMGDAQDTSTGDEITKNVRELERQKELLIKAEQKEKELIKAVAKEDKNMIKVKKAILATKKEAERSNYETTNYITTKELRESAKVWIEYEKMRKDLTLSSSHVTQLKKQIENIESILQKLHQQKAADFSPIKSNDGGNSSNCDM